MRHTITTHSNATTKIHLILFSVVVLQWFYCLYLMQSKSSSVVAFESSVSAAPPRYDQEYASRLDISGTSHKDSIDNIQSPPSDSGPSKWSGVALFLLLKRPRWYTKRYQMLVDNTLSNIPRTWALQVMYSRRFLFDDVLGYHRGLRRKLFLDPRIIRTELPKHLERSKPNSLWKEIWVWENVVADRVITVHGDGVLCGNTDYPVDYFAQWDYVGIPWNQFGGFGGNGVTHSIRNRQAVLAALRYPNRAQDRRNDVQLVATLLKINQVENASWKIAPPEQTERFGGTRNQLMMSNGTLVRDTTYGPLVISGTLPDLSDEARNWVLGTCPEIKAVFPSLHHPACFGARPDPIKCAEALGLAQACHNETVGKHPI